LLWYLTIPRSIIPQSIIPQEKITDRSCDENHTDFVWQLYKRPRFVSNPRIHSGSTSKLNSIHPLIDSLPCSQLSPFLIFCLDLVFELAPPLHVRLVRHERASTRHFQLVLKLDRPTDRLRTIQSLCYSLPAGSRVTPHPLSRIYSDNAIAYSARRLTRRFTDTY
jgi:hypothetical protein